MTVVRATGCLVACLILGAAALASGAQAGSAQLAGVVRGPDGLAMPSAIVTITNLATNQRRVVTTTVAGSFAALGLSPGEYEVHVALAGFRPLVRNGIRLETGESARVELELAVGGVSEAVTVTADAPALQTDRATLGYTVDRERIVDLPLNGRTFVSLAALAPGVALPPGSQLPRINGGRPRVNEYLYDGISVLQPEPGQVAFFPVIDAIQEFRIESNSPPAEFGRFNGGVINLATKSGSNVLQGTAFDFARHEALNARHLFAPTGDSKPRFRRQQFGGVLGGPIRRDRSFFFVDYQAQRQTIGRIVVSTVPTVLQRHGVFTEAVGGRVPIIYDPDTPTIPFPRNRIPVERFDPVAAALLERYPLPTSDGTANNYRRLGDEINDQNQFGVRIDHRVTARDQTFARLSYFRERFIPVSPLPDGSGAAVGTPGPQQTRAWAVASQHQHVFSARLLNELRIGDTRRAVRRLPFTNALPTFVISGYEQLGAPPNTASDFETSVTHLVDALTFVRGAHTIKTGVDFRWQRLNIVQPSSPTGYFQFTSLFTGLPGTPDTGSPLASFLLGRVQTFSIDVQQQEIRHRAAIQEYFVQNDWRLHDRITVNGGVRYTLNFPSIEENNQAAVFNLQRQQLEYLGRDGHPRSARRLHKLNLGPRLGAVTRLSDNLVARAGYALIWIEQAGMTTPFTAPVFPFLQTVSQRSLDGIEPAFVLANGPTISPLPLTPDAGVGHGVFAVNGDRGSGYVQQWNVALQRELAANTSVELAYVGSAITRAGVPDANVNQLTVSQLALGSVLLEHVPNPYFGTIPRSSSVGDPLIPRAQLLKPYPRYTTVSLYRDNVGTTRYHGLAARLDHRWSKGLAFHVSYTRSRLMDDASSVFDASILTGPAANYPVADSFNRRLEWDHSTGDIPHVFVASGLWHLPLLNGWTVTGVLTWQSGVPVAVTQSTNYNAFAGFGVQRPNLTGDPDLPPEERSITRWFNTDAFATAPQFTLGSSSRNPVRGPGYRNLDVALMRRVPLRSGDAIEIRVEVFNALNTPALANPNGVFGTAAFGTITSAGDPRVVQLAVKFHF